MKNFAHWKTLSELLDKGSLSFADLAFAQSVLKELGTDEECHAALLAALFCLSRLGHLALDISKPLAFEGAESLNSLIHCGLQSFPAHAIADAPEGHPDAWICRYQNHLYLQKNWICESEIVLHLHRLSSAAPSLTLKEPLLGDRLNQAQKEAVKNGIKHSFSLLTGGPGTGKTFTAAELVKSCLLSLSPEQKENFHIILAAPTGKAVAQLECNLKKAIGDIPHLRSGTLHSILGIKTSFSENPLQPLFADLILVDECSMIDSRLFSRLLASLPTGSRLILIGDKDQLPPVEAGSIFADLLDLNIYPSAKLTHCLRSDSAEILSLAKSIKDGNSLEVITALSSQDWIDLDEDKKSLSQLYNQLWERCKDKFPSCFTHKPAPEEVLAHLGKFSLLSCMRQGTFGVDAINAYFLEQFLKQMTPGAWFVAPIMVTRNDADLQLFNGDLGFLIRQNTTDLQIDDYILFPNRQIPALALTSFEYAYCLSVHKSQGSEYNQTLILIPNGSESFGREVLYTALTRAKTQASFAGSQSTLLQALARTSRKSSGLSSRLSDRKILAESTFTLSPEQQRMMELVYEEVERAIQEGNPPFAAIITDSENNILAIAHNQANTKQLAIAHAEIEEIQLAC